MSEQKEKRPVIFSGMQPSGSLTLGSYMGALQNWVSLSATHDCFYCIVDMHTITVRQNPAELRRRCLEQIAQYIAAGLDPDTCTLFIQSHVREHAELAWILNCYTMYGELSRMVQFKDKSSKNADNINAGLFTYPALQTADILLYQTNLVPVGEDQRQHIELARDVANRFNGIYGDVFAVPELSIPKEGAKIMSLSDPTSKMSKSDTGGGCIYLMDKPEVIMKAFKRAVTDLGNEIRFDKEEKPGISNLMNIYAVATGKTYAEIENEFAGKGYGDFKIAVGESVVELLRPFREKAELYMADKAYLTEVYTKASDHAAKVASRTLQKVYKKVGFVLK